MDLQASRVAVADVNHGGLVLAEELCSLGYDAFAVDVYGTRKPADSRIRVVRPADAGRFDALVAPVHMPPGPLTDYALKEGIPIYTHHRMAGLIVAATGRLEGIRSVEITGTRGKTTTAFALAGMLAAAGERVLLHTSSGLSFDGVPLGKRLSVTPASIIGALDEPLQVRPTVFIAEVSLGGCGTADVGVITTLQDDYPVARGTSRSSEAKMQMIELAKTGSTVVHDSSFCAIGAQQEITFGRGGDVYYDNDNRIGSALFPGMTIDPGRSRELDPAYRQPVLCAAAAALALGLRPEDVGRGLAGFEGVPGRMKFEALEGRRLLDNSSSGLSLAGVAYALAAGGAVGPRVLVVGEEKYNVCEGLPPCGVLEIARDVKSGEVVLVGERLKDVAAASGYAWAPDLKGGITAALAMTCPGDTIISCVKTWR
jgi:UDP-N-acetylmuramoylalanine--D-glutamate ligase